MAPGQPVPQARSTQGRHRLLDRRKLRRGEVHVAVGHLQPAMPQLLLQADGVAAVCRKRCGCIRGTPAACPTLRIICCTASLGVGKNGDAIRRISTGAGIVV